jgi:hypothetical protein
MRFGEGFTFTYTKSLAFMRKAWWLAPVPIIPILTYSMATIHKVLPEDHSAAAYYPVLMLDQILWVASTYWVMGFLTLDEDVVEAVSVNAASAKSFAPYLARVSAIWILFGVAIDTGLIGNLLYSVTVWLFACLFAPWAVMAPSGSTAIGPVRCTKAALPGLPWAFVFCAVVMLPIGMSLLFFEAFQTNAENVWIVTVAQLGYWLMAGAGLVVSNVAIFVVAHRMGVRLKNTHDVERVFD